MTININIMPTKAFFDSSQDYSNRQDKLLERHFLDKVLDKPCEHDRPARQSQIPHSSAKETSERTKPVAVAHDKEGGSQGSMTTDNATSAVTEKNADAALTNSALFGVTVSTVITEIKIYPQSLFAGGHLSYLAYQNITIPDIAHKTANAHVEQFTAAQLNSRVNESLRQATDSMPVQIALATSARISGVAPDECDGSASVITRAVALNESLLERRRIRVAVNGDSAEIVIRDYFDGAAELDALVEGAKSEIRESGAHLQRLICNGETLWSGNTPP